MKARVFIRGATERDVAAIHSLDATLFAPQDQFSVRRYRYLLRSPHAITYVAERNGQLVGSIVALIRRSQSGRVSGRIYSIGVARAEQRRGVGARLIKRIEHELRLREVERILLETRAASKRARSFFSMHGYQVTGDLSRYYFDDDGVKMSKSL